MTAKVGLTVEGAFDADKIADGFDGISAAADDLAGTVADAGDSVADAADQMSSVSDTAKDVSSNSRLASSSLGALAGGLDAVGATGAADALQQVQTVTSTLGGVGKALTLVLKSQTVQSVAAKGAMIAQAVATKAISAASKAYAVVQWALNAALSANPIGLIVIGLAALVAGVVLAYKKSDTFRSIVDHAFAVAKTAVESVVDVVKGVPGFIEKVINKVGFLAPAFSLAKTLIVGYFEAMTLPLRTVIGLIKDVVDWISKIDLPDFSDLPGVPGRVAAGFGGGGGFASPFSHTPVNVNVNGGFVGNEVQLARTIQAAVAAELRRRGIRP